MIVSLNAGCGAFSDADKPGCVRERDGYIGCQRKPCVRTSRRFQIRDPVTSDHELGECRIGDEDAQAQRGQKIPLLVSEYGMIGRRERRTMVLGKVSKQTEDLRVRYKLLARGQLLTTLVSTLVKQVQIEVGFVIAYADLVLRLPCPAELRENKLLADLNIAWRRRWGVRAVSQPFPGKFDQSTGSRSRDRIEFRKKFFIKVGLLRNDAPF